MNDRDYRPAGDALLRKVMAIPPLRLPGVLVFLVSQKKARPVSSRLAGLLDADEDRRSKRIALSDLRHRFVTGRAALRCVLSKCESAAAAATDWRFGVSMNGKPYIRAPEGSNWSFNLSYADDLIAIAVSNEVEVGIDIECSQQIPQGDLPWHLFSDGEKRRLRETTGADLPPVFLRLWTLKEAIAKRTGQGFATEFSEIDTTVLNVAEGVEAVAHHPTSDALLFHTHFTIDGETVFVAVSAAPRGWDHAGPMD